MIVKVVGYAYVGGVVSSRKIGKRLERDVAFRMLAASNFLAHRTLRKLRRVHLFECLALFAPVVQFARVSIQPLGPTLLRCQCTGSCHAPTPHPLSNKFPL